ncbi:MAG: c-type cytochrome [Myxococcota bacterium]
MAHTRRWTSWGLCALVAGVFGVADAEAEPLSPRAQALFGQTCAVCHVKPGLGVPVLGVEADWIERRGRGIDALVASTVRGVGQMPPLGTCGACTESDLRALVGFLAGLDPAETEGAP